MPCSQSGAFRSDAWSRSQCFPMRWAIVRFELRQRPPRNRWGEHDHPASVAPFPSFRPTPESRPVPGAICRPLLKYPDRRLARNEAKGRGHAPVPTSRHSVRLTPPASILPCRTHAKTHIFYTCNRNKLYTQALCGIEKRGGERSSRKVSIGPQRCSKMAAIAVTGLIF